MTLRIYQSADYTTVKALDASLFPGVDRVSATDVSWLVHDPAFKAVGFATGKLWPPDNYFYFTRCGVLTEARGKGLQRRFIRARLRYAKAQGCLGAYTYTLPFNVSSANNLIACGFRLWRPANKWAGAEALYWTRDFK